MTYKRIEVTCDEDNNCEVSSISLNRVHRNKASPHEISKDLKEKFKQVRKEKPIPRPAANKEPPGLPKLKKIFGGWRL
jgi:hypothetical protein